MYFVKTALYILFTFIFSFVFAGKVHASLVTIEGDGKVVVNVLAVETSTTLQIPEKKLVAVTDALSDNSETSSVALTKKDGKIQLSVSGNSGDKSLDVTNYKENVIEIEERPQTEKLSIQVADNHFLIRQRGIIATTDYELNIDPDSAGLTLKTPSGLRFLTVLPREAVDIVMRTKLINQIPFDQQMTIEEDNGQLTYTIRGEREFDIFGLYNYPLAVTTKVSATTGEILSIEDPRWLKFAAFLFV
jgi:hypothetical protein